MKLPIAKIDLSRRTKAFTLEELVVSMAITSFAIGGIVSGYMMASKRAEWSAYSQAAQSLAQQKLEQTRAAKWDPYAYPPVDQVVSTNFPDSLLTLDLPVTTNAVPTAQVKVSIVTLSANPPLKSVVVSSIWSYLNHGPFTNSVASLRSPDQ